MKEFIVNNFQFIIQSVGTILLIVLLIRACSPVEDRSELLQYKLDQIDTKIEDLNKQQKILNDSIIGYKKDILKIDSTISKIKTDRKTINNYYEVQRDIILGYTAKQIDSALRIKYKY
jgi:hypothetical protein